jgi:hypothetical protein
VTADSEVARLMNVLAARKTLSKNPDPLQLGVGGLGRVRIVAYGGWEVPLRFLVRRRGRLLLFHRAFDPVTGEAPFRYSVYRLPSTADLEAVLEAGFEPPEASRLLGSVPAADLDFERRAETACVTRASLAAALERSGVA